MTRRNYRLELRGLAAKVEEQVCIADYLCCEIGTGRAGRRGTAVRELLDRHRSGLKKIRTTIREMHNAA